MSRRPRHDNADAGKGMRIMVVGPYPPPEGGVSNFIRYTSNILTDHGAEVIVKRVGSGPGTPSFMLPLVELGRIARLAIASDLKEAQVVHVHSSSFWSFFRSAQYVLLARHLGRGKVVLHIHSGEFAKFFADLPSPLRRWGRRVVRRADLVIVTSPSWLPALKDVTGAVPATVVYNGFDPSKFHPMAQAEARSALGVPRDKRVLVSIGSLEPVKGHRYLLTALREVFDARDDVIAYIVGSGSQRTQLISQAEALGLKGRVFFKEQEPHERIPLWLGASDLHVLPSVREGNPVVMFECLGCGRPFVGTRVGGVPDVIISEKLGLLCEPLDPAGLARTIMTALDREWDRGAIVKYSERFTWERVSEDLLSIYRGFEGGP